MRKISKEDWLTAGMKSIAAEGENAITIDKLCAVLNVSKGSFYHHFKNIDDYVVSLMNLWEKENTHDIIKAAEEGKTLEEKVEKLNTIVINTDHLLEVRIRAWSVRETNIRQFVNKVDEERIGYLKSLYLLQGRDAEYAARLAQLEYATFVGMQELFRELPQDQKFELSQLFHKLLNSLS